MTIAPSLKARVLAGSPSGDAKREASRRAAAEDALLVRRFVAGDESAFEEIVQRHREKIFGIVHRLLRNRADAEEIVQDTFIRAHRGLANFRGDSSLARGCIMWRSISLVTRHEAV